MVTKKLIIIIIIFLKYLKLLFLIYFLKNFGLIFIDFSQGFELNNAQNSGMEIDRFKD